MTAEQTDSGVLTLERKGRVGVVTLNRPERLNALNQEVQTRLLEVTEEIRDDDGIWAVVVAGAGRGFCSGADVSGGWRAPEDPPSQNARLDEMGWVGRQAWAVYGLDKPTVAAVNGIAAGAGMSLALACDLRVGNENAAFRTMFIERS